MQAGCPWGDTGPRGACLSPAALRAACSYALVLWGSSLIVPPGPTHTSPWEGRTLPGEGSHPWATD